MKIVLTYVSVDDWCALYVDDELVFQDHSLHGWDAIHLLEEHLQNKEWTMQHHALTEYDEEYVMQVGQFPDSLAKLIAGKWFGDLAEID